MVKRNLLILMTMFFISHNIIAEQRSGLYLKGAIGANKFNNAKEKNYVDDIEIDSNKSKGEVSPSFNVGLGFYLNDYIRHDLTIGYSKANFKNSSINLILYNGQESLIGISEVKRKSDLYSAMFNSYIDLPVNSNVMFFFGGGIGIAFFWPFYRAFRSIN
jgi:opacity protein-like surface antigen